MANKAGHRRFGNIRRAAVRPVPDPLSRAGRPDRTGPETYERKGDADRALVADRGADQHAVSGPILSAAKVKLG